VNVLHHGQRDLAMRFAGRPRSSPAQTRAEWEGGALEHLRDPLAAQPGTDIDLVLGDFPELW
jgi:hypothetical protein